MKIIDPNNKPHKPSPAELKQATKDLATRKQQHDKPAGLNGLDKAQKNLQRSQKLAAEGKRNYKRVLEQARRRY